MGREGHGSLAEVYQRVAMPWSLPQTEAEALSQQLGPDMDNRVQSPGGWIWQNRARDQGRHCFQRGHVLQKPRQVWAKTGNSQVSSFRVGSPFQTPGCPCRRQPAICFFGNKRFQIFKIIMMTMFLQNVKVRGAYIDLNASNSVQDVCPCYQDPLSLYGIDLFCNRTKFKTSLTDISPFLTIVALLLTKC